MGRYTFSRGKRSVTTVVNDSPVDCQSRGGGAPQSTKWLSVAKSDEGIPMSDTHGNVISLAAFAKSVPIRDRGTLWRRERAPALQWEPSVISTDPERAEGV